jgi:hypothetical protein
MFEGAAGLLLLQLLITVVINPEVETRAIAPADLTKKFLRDIFIKFLKSGKSFGKNYFTARKIWE